jgi:Acyl-CoA reductase (LuxC)
LIVQQLVPDATVIEVEELLRRLRDAPRLRVDPFHESRVAFSDAVSSAILHHPRSRAYPELIALAFWLRRASVARLADRFAALERAGSLRAPRGLAFHVPPTNVDTLFVYSLIASFLVGNLNLVRVSSNRRTEQVTLLCEVLRQALAQERFAEFSAELAIVSYGHEAEPTAAVSKEADVRLLWGGNDTVDHLRAVPSSRGAHDLTFGDRFSFAVLRPEAVLDGDPLSRTVLAERLFNDVYWFDQLACASPRLLVWVGPREKVDGARRLLFDELARVIAARGYRLETGAAMSKLTFMYGAMIDRPVEWVYRAGNELLVVRLKDLADFDRAHPGAGLFFEATVDALADLVGFVNRQDQTVTAHGFSAEELTAFARSLCGRGVDRIVRFGEALTFSSLWDGYDLLAELTRTVDIASAA